MTIEEAAEILPWSVTTLRRWRATWPDKGRKGPRPRIVEGRIFYIEDEVRQWFRDQLDRSV